MPDREKYIEVLSKTAKAVKELNEDAPIKISLECIEDILALLKEQDAVEPFTYYHVFICPVCKNTLFREQKFCHECGKRIEWKGR